MAGVLVVENDESYAALLADTLAGAGLAGIVKTDVFAALDFLDSERPDLLLTAVVLKAGQPHGFALSRMARLLHPALPILYLTSFPELADVEQPLGKVLAKPITPDALIAAVSEVIPKPKCATLPVLNAPVSRTPRPHHDALAVAKIALGRSLDAFLD